MNILFIVAERNKNELDQISLITDGLRSCGYDLTILSTKQVTAYKDHCDIVIALNSASLQSAKRWSVQKKIPLVYFFTTENIRDYPQDLSMFRQKGCLQIRTQKVLHFPAIPYFTRVNSTGNSILVHHLGNLTREIRERKYLFYQKEDRLKNLSSYEYLIDNFVTLKKVSQLKLS